MPSLETLERFASALDVPFYKLFYNGDGHAATRQTPPRTLELADETGLPGAEAHLAEAEGAGRKDERCATELSL